jgi:hypothetical protein
MTHGVDAVRRRIFWRMKHNEAVMMISTAADSDRPVVKTH